MQKDILADIEENEVDEIDQLADFTEDDVQENEDSKDSQSEKNDEKDTQPDEGDKNTQSEEDLPFHEHPRFKELIEEKNNLKKELEEFKKEAEQKFSVSDNKDTNLPSWWVTLYGNDELSKKAYDEYSNHNKSEREQIRKEIIEEYKSEQETLKKQEQEQNKWVDDRLKELKDTGAKFEKNEFIKFAIENPIRDSNDNIDLKKIYRFYEIEKSNKTKDTSKSEAKKKLASSTVSQDGKSEDTKTFKTSKDLRGKSFSSLLENI